MYTKKARKTCKAYQNIGTWSDEFRKYLFNLFMVENMRPGVKVKTGNVANDFKSKMLFEYNSEIHLVYKNGNTGILDNMSYQLSSSVYKICYVTYLRP